MLLFNLFLVLFAILLLWIKPVNILKDYGIYRATGEEMAMVPVYNGVFIEQDFDNPQNADSIEICISAANDSYKGSYRLDLYDEKNNYIAGWIKDKFDLASAEWIEFKLDRNMLYSGSKYKIIISAEGLTYDNAIVVYVANEKEQYLQTLLINTAEKEGSLCMGVYKSISNYFAIAALAVLFIAANVWWHMKEYGVEKYSIPLLIGTGLIMFLIMAPGSGPDEIHHYYSAFELSNAIMGRQDLSEVEVKYKDTLPLHVNSNRAFVKTLIEFGINYDDGGETFDYDGVKDKLIQPLSHMAPALGITLGRLFGINFICIYELGRMFNLLAYMVMAWLAVRIVPENKELMLMFGILPMYMHQACQMSYDPIVNGIMLIYIAYIYKVIYEGNSFTWNSTIFVLVLLSLVSPIKVIYSLLIAMILAIPVKQFESYKDKILKFIILGIGVFAILFIMKWSDIYNVFWRNDYRISGDTYSPAFMFQHPLDFVKLVLYSLENSLLKYMKEVIGISLSGYTIKISEYLVILFWVVLILCSFAGEASIKTTNKQKAVIIFTALLGFVTVIITFIFAYTPYGYPNAQGVQGRYFTPFIIPMLFCFNTDKININLNRMKLFIVVWFVEVGYIVDVMNQIYI